MKVRKTFELTDAQRIGISLIKNGTLGHASREDIEEYLEDIVQPQLDELAIAVVSMRKQIIAQLSPPNAEGSKED